MTKPALLMVILAIAVPIAPALPQDTRTLTSDAQSQEATGKIKELQKQRLEVLKSLTDQLAELFQEGRAESDALLDARMALLEAELDAATTTSDRLALYKALVEDLKQSENVARARFEAARGSMTAVLAVQAKRLEAEIRLEQAQAGLAGVSRPKILVSTPEIKDVTVTEQYVCQIQAQRHINIRALKTGSIETIPVREGQPVKAGDLLFKMVPSIDQARLAAELAEVKLAELELQNVEKSFESKAASEDEVTLSRTKLEKAQVKAELAKVQLGFDEVRAPFDGIVGRLLQQPGSAIEEAETLTTLSDNSTMWVYFNVPESRYLEYVAAGEHQPEQVELRLANGRPFDQSGTISAIQADFNRQTGNIPFRADFSNPNGVLRHGMTGNVLVHRTLKNAVVIPQRATFEILDQRYVFVVDAQDVVHRREVVVKHELADSFVIEPGLDKGDRIIVDGVRQVSDGDKVTYEFVTPDKIPGFEAERSE